MELNFLNFLKWLDLKTILSSSLKEQLGRETNCKARILTRPQRFIATPVDYSVRVDFRCGGKRHTEREREWETSQRRHQGRLEGDGRHFMGVYEALCVTRWKNDPPTCLQFSIPPYEHTLYRCTIKQGLPLLPRAHQPHTQFEPVHNFSYTIRLSVNPLCHLFLFSVLSTTIFLFLFFTFFLRSKWGWKAI